MNDLDLCLESRLRSSQPLRHIRHWILYLGNRRDKGLVPKRPPIWTGLWGIKWSRDRDLTWLRKVKLVILIRSEPNISKTAGDAT